jgi:hypothetical protein
MAAFDAQLAPYLGAVPNAEVMGAVPQQARLEEACLTLLTSVPNAVDCTAVAATAHCTLAFEWAGRLWRFGCAISQALDPGRALAASAALPAALLAGSVVGALTEDEAALSCWVAVLRHGCLSPLEAAVAESGAWEWARGVGVDRAGVGAGAGPPLPNGLLGHSEPEDMMLRGTDAGGDDCEFKPPRVAAVAVEQLRLLVERSAVAPTADAQRVCPAVCGWRALCRPRGNQDLSHKAVVAGTQHERAGLLLHACMHVRGQWAYGGSAVRP